MPSFTRFGLKAHTNNIVAIHDDVRIKVSLHTVVMLLSHLYELVSTKLLQLYIHSFIHSFRHFYSASSSPLLLRGAPDYSTDTVSEFHAEAHRQLQVKDLPKVP